MSRYSFTVPIPELGRIQFYAKKHDLRFEGNPIYFSSSKQAHVVLTGDNMSDFIQDIHEIEKCGEYLDKEIAEKKSMWYNMKNFFKRIFT